MAYVVVATWVAKPGQAEKIRQILETVTPGNRAEEKMLEFQAHVSRDDPDTFVLYEKYVDASGYADHRATDAFQKHVLGEAIPNLAERSVREFETIG
ncbi:putative quinol monooxygenase [Amycolatopsis sp. NBC_01480]|jgi:quinol monooxygenase YgiN|uniref:putative quinol monooxygenase n=1 Tax=Amycolatopsis sp. NBC_01480 TaxID=2903562 RepID=UPI002E29F94A|nr:antibiotic biosynthesis monooxygenase [Amycolatopsis sp. NBC_01480]